MVASKVISLQPARQQLSPMRNPLPCLHRQVVDGLPAESGCWSGRDGWVDLGARRLTTKGTKDTKEEAAKSIQSNAACRDPCFQLRAHRVLRVQHPEARVKIPLQEFEGKDWMLPRRAMKPNPSLGPFQGEEVDNRAAAV
jgi:hypothetical protein